MLIDGNSLTYRAFFALPTDMATASGQVTNAVYGFTAMLTALLRDHQPDGIAVAFDLPDPTFRHQRLGSYKANREKQPDILYEQLALVRELVEALGFVVVDAKGFEADDVLATLATVARDAGQEVMIVTGDRDSYQLVEDPLVRVLYNKRGVSDYALYDEAGILERTGVHPRDYVAYAALRGDTSDNLPGVPGVGEKTAAKLINAYGGLAGIFAASEEQTPKLRQNLEENESLALLNEEMMVLVRDVPLGLTVDDLARGPVQVDQANALFDALELSTARQRLGPLLGTDFGVDDDEEAGPSGGELAVTVHQVSGAKDLAALEKNATAECILGLGLSDQPEDGFALSLPGTPEKREAWWISAAALNDSAVVEALGKILGPEGSGIATHRAKATVALLRRFGVDPLRLQIDTELAAYLLDPADSKTDLPSLFGRYTGGTIPELGVPDGQLDLGGDTTDSGEMAGYRAAAVAQLVDPLAEALVAQNLCQLNETIEIPLVRVLVKMEEIGVGVDVEELTRLRDHLTAECVRLRTTIHKAAGEEFNVNSPKQLQVILFDKLGLTPGKKTKTGFSTNAATLERLRNEHPMVEHLLAYREVEKLRSTYGEGLLAEVGPGDRIRASFNQTVARTGRLSSDAPNLHNIPVRTEAGRAFRRAFVPAAGCQLLVADYNQIELRCIAHLAQDPGLIAAFTAGNDVHSAVAAQVWHLEPSEVTYELRSRAKMVSYGLAYGMEAYGLSQRLDIPVGEATEILEAFFGAFPAVQDYMGRTIEEARQKGYTETLFGRRRRIPELSASQFNVRQAGERQAMNSGIQGLAADIFKVALIGIDQYLEQENLSSRLILQVHDEVILEVPVDEEEAALAFVPEIMGNAFDLDVELTVDVALGATWADAKG
jgi:DNA polymerase-1